MEFRSATLKNGLEIVAECNPDAYSCALGFFVKTGSRDEEADVAGVSHFLEHMVFKGTAKRSPDDVNREFDEIGANYNAATSEEKTVYYASLLPEYLPRALELWSDVLRPALRAADFETEKQVILEEIKMYEDMPPYSADDRVKELYFGSHPLSKSVLGTMESIRALKVEQMRAFFARQYSPKNVVLVGAGKIDFEQFKAQAEQLCGDWEPVACERKLLPVPPPKPQLVRETRAQSTQQYVLQLAPGPGGEDAATRFAAALLSVILGDDSGSRLYWALVDSGQAESASLNYRDYSDCGVFSTSLSCAPEAVDDNLAEVEKVYNEALKNGLTVAELQRAQNKICAVLVRTSERPRNRLFTVGANWIKRREYRTVKESLELFQKRTMTEVLDILVKYPPQNAVTMTVGPGPEGPDAEVDTAAAVAEPN